MLLKRILFGATDNFILWLAAYFEIFKTSAVIFNSTIKGIKAYNTFIRVVSIGNSSDHWVW